MEINRISVSSEIASFPGIASQEEDGSQGLFPSPLPRSHPVVSHTHSWTQDGPQIVRLPASLPRHVHINCSQVGPVAVLRFPCTPTISFMLITLFLVVNGLHTHPWVEKHPCGFALDKPSFSQCVSIARHSSPWHPASDLSYLGPWCQTPETQQGFRRGEQDLTNKSACPKWAAAALRLRCLSPLSLLLAPSGIKEQVPGSTQLILWSVSRSSRVQRQIVLSI